MRPAVLRALRIFVSASFVVGGILLLSEALILRARPPGSEGTALLALAWSLGLVAAVVAAQRTPWPWPWPAALLLGSLLVAIAWAHLDASGAGHLVLSGLAPAASVLAGLGLYLRHRWAWAVGLAISGGIGPLFLTFAPLPDVAYAGAFALFLADALALLALGDSLFTRDGS